MQVLSNKFFLVISGLIFTSLAANANPPPIVPVTPCGNGDCVLVKVTNNTNQVAENIQLTQYVSNVSQTVAAQGGRASWNHTFPTCSPNSGVNEDSVISYKFGNLGVCIFDLNAYCGSYEDPRTHQISWVWQYVNNGNFPYYQPQCSSPNLVVSGSFPNYTISQ